MAGKFSSALRKSVSQQAGLKSGEDTSLSGSLLISPPFWEAIWVLKAPFQPAKDFQHLLVHCRTHSSGSRLMMGKGGVGCLLSTRGDKPQHSSSFLSAAGTCFEELLAKGVPWRGKCVKTPLLGSTDGIAAVWLESSILSSCGQAATPTRLGKG